MNELAVLRSNERSWSVARDRAGFAEVERCIEAAASSYDDASREAITMAAWELAQNLLKYGPVEAAHAGTIAIAAEGEVVRIRTRNVPESQKNARRLIQTVARISSSPSVSNLYRERVEELFASPHQPHTRLGLVRVAYEGGFRLACSYRAPHVEIVAERRCGRAT